MVDLQSQYQQIKHEAEAAMQEVISNAAFIDGPQVKQFAAELSEYLGVGEVIPCANGTDALQIALMALDLPAESEILLPSFNYVAAAEVVALLGHKPVFCEVNPRTFTIDPELAANKITDKTAAIIPVHLFGQCANMEPLIKLALEHNLYIIEDAAQAIGAEYTSSDGSVLAAGFLGSAGTTSFFPSKNLGCMGDGGAMFTADKELAVRLRMIAHHGQSKKYHYQEVGVNSRLDTLQAAFLRVKLAKLNDYTLARQKAADYYDKAFANSPEIKTPLRAEYSTHVFHQYTILVDPLIRDGLKEHLAAQNIPSMIYYPVPLHLQEAYEYLGHKEGDFPVTELLCKSVISLPMHTELDEEQLAYITWHITEYTARHSRPETDTYLVPDDASGI